MMGCEREEIHVYTAPKDQIQPVVEADNPHGTSGDSPHAAMAELPRPQLTWTLPADWKEAPPDNAVTLAAFALPGGKDGEGGDVSIARLANLSGNEVLLVNMFREIAGLEPLSKEESLKQMTPVEAGGEKGKLFEIGGKTKDGHSVEIVTAIVHRADGSWFYRLAGDPAIVSAQKAAFMDFIKSVRIKEGQPQGQRVASTDTAQDFHWTVPTDWKVTPHNEMQVARFAVPGKAEVFVSVFSNDTGGTLANVNRWRRQLKLPEVTAQDLPSLISSLDSGNSQSLLVDMTSNGQELIGAIVPRDGRYWFYKLQGDGGAVAPQKNAFIAFAKSIP